jgi:hypothetical protein
MLRTTQRRSGGGDGEGGGGGGELIEFEIGNKRGVSLREKKAQGIGTNLICRKKPHFYKISTD